MRPPTSPHNCTDGRSGNNEVTRGVDSHGYVTRTDSGFAEDLTSESATSMPRTSQGRNPISASHGPLKKFSSTHNSRRSSTATSQTTPRPTPCHRLSSRRSSTTSSLYRPSNPSSRRSSSFLISQPSDRRPSLPVRRAATAYARFSTNSPFGVPTSSRHSVHAFDSYQLMNNPFASRHAAHSASLSSLTNHSPANTTAVPSLGDTPRTLTNKEQPHPQPTYSNHVQATTIDWTLPSTRQRQYSEIESSYRGIRGLLRRLTPSFCQKKGNELGFYSEKDSDAGTVRRYRLSLGDEESEVGKEGEEEGKTKDMDEEGKGIDVGDVEKGGLDDGAFKKKLKGWSCFGFDRRKLGGKA